MGFSNRQVVDLVERSMWAARVKAHEELSRGLSVLAAVAATAPLLGLFLTVTGIKGSFRGTTISKEAAMAMASEGMAGALERGAIALLVAVAVYVVYRIFVAQVETLDREMERASLDVLNFVARNLPRA